MVIIKKQRAMKEAMKIWSAWKKSIQWDEMTMKQELMSVWFSLSFVVLGASGDNLSFAFLAVANFAASAYCCVKYVPMDEDDD